MLKDEHKRMTEWEARHTFADSFRSAAEVSCMSLEYCIVGTFGKVCNIAIFFKGQ